jgi:hypothetical protein
MRKRAMPNAIRPVQEAVDERLKGRKTASRGLAPAPEAIPLRQKNKRGPRGPFHSFTDTGFTFWARHLTGACCLGLADDAQEQFGEGST